MTRTLATLMILASAALSQTATAPAALSLEQKEEFLKNAKVVSTRSAPKGITNTRRATLSDGVLTHEASIQTIDEHKARFEAGTGGTEINFVDSYKYNIAAYRLARMLGLGHMVPPSVSRSYEGNSAAWTWWVDDVQLDEEQRGKKKIKAPDQDAWAKQYNIMLTFHQLIYNVDPNQGNILYDKDWHIWMIDHTRSFRLYTTLQNPKVLSTCDQVLLANMKKLDRGAVAQELKGLLTDQEIKGLMARRDRIVAFFEKKGPKGVYEWLPPK